MRIKEIIRVTLWYLLLIFTESTLFTLLLPDDPHELQVINALIAALLALTMWVWYGIEDDDSN